MNDPQKTDVPPATPVPQKTAAPAEKQPRSPVERIVVWGGILLLIALTFFEWRAKNAYETTLNKATDVMEQVDSGDMETFDLAMFEGMIQGSPDVSEAQKAGLAAMEKSYTWNGLIKSHSMAVKYTDPDQEILSVVTKDAPEPPPPAKPKDDDADADPEMADGQQPQMDGPRPGGGDQPRGDRPERPEMEEEGAETPAEDAPAETTPAETSDAPTEAEVDAPKDDAPPADAPKEDAPTAETPAVEEKPADAPE